mgnify:CR=1 FL=1
MNTERNLEAQKKEQSLLRISKMLEEMRRSRKDIRDREKKQREENRLISYLVNNIWYYNG